MSSTSPTNGRCAAGGLIFRGGVAKVKCGNGQDAGQECGTSHAWCPATDASSSLDGLPCEGAWRPSDIHVYLARSAHELQSRCSPTTCYNEYNEFLIDGLAWERALPQTIDAFMIGGSAARQHAAFLAKYGLGAEGVP